MSWRGRRLPEGNRTSPQQNAAATLALAAITISGAVRPADVYAFALLAGVIFAFDAPARQSFATEAGQSAPAARGSSGAPRVTGSTWAAVRYVRGRPDVLWTIFLVGMV